MKMRDDGLNLLDNRELVICAMVVKKLSLMGLCTLAFNALITLYAPYVFNSAKQMYVNKDRKIYFKLILTFTTGVTHAFS